jgi:hypothetical protein
VRSYEVSFTGGVTIRFPAKPVDAVRSLLKAHGFRFVRGEWYRRSARGAADMLARLDRILEPGKPDGACWKCNNPRGFFRPHGPFTPVYCDACHAALNTPDPSDLAYEDQCARACGL